MSVRPLTKLICSRVCFSQQANKAVSILFFMSYLSHRFLREELLLSSSFTPQIARSEFWPRRIATLARPLEFINNSPCILKLPPQSHSRGQSSRNFDRTSKSGHSLFCLRSGNGRKTMCSLKFCKLILGWVRPN